MSKRVISVLLILCVFLTGCGKKEKELQYTLDTENNIFNIQDNEQAQTEVMGAYNLRYRGIDTQKGIVATQQEISIPLTIETLGYPTKMGIIVVLDGKPISYHTEEDEKDTYIKPYELNKEEVIDITIYGKIQEGEIGDKLPLYIIGILEPSYLPDTEADVSYGNYHKELSLLPITVELQCSIKERETVYEKTTTQILDAKEYDAYKMEDGSNLLDTNANWVIESNQDYKNKLISNKGVICLSLEGFGGDSASYSIIPFINHEPVIINGKENHLVKLEKGKKTKWDFNIDISSYPRKNTLYVLVVPTADSYLNTTLSSYKTESHLLINDIVK